MADNVFVFIAAFLLGAFIAGALLLGSVNENTGESIKAGVLEYKGKVYRLQEVTP